MFIPSLSRNQDMSKYVLVGTFLHRLVVSSRATGTTPLIGNQKTVLLFSFDGLADIKFYTDFSYNGRVQFL